MKAEDFPLAEFDKVDGTLLYDCLLNQKPDIVLNDYVLAFPQGSVRIFHYIMNAFMRANSAATSICCKQGKWTSSKELGA